MTMIGPNLRSTSLSTALVAFVLLAGGCGSHSNGRATGAPYSPALSGAGETSAEISGTVVDALSGLPVAGAKIEGPGGTRATSDEHGRFHLRGLPVGAEGEIVARGKDNAEARNQLRPLRPGNLEVVLRLRRT